MKININLRIAKMKIYLSMVQANLIKVVGRLKKYRIRQLKIIKLKSMFLKIRNL